MVGRECLRTGFANNVHTIRENVVTCVRYIIALLLSPSTDILVLMSWWPGEMSWCSEGLKRSLLMREGAGSKPSKCVVYHSLQSSGEPYNVRTDPCIVLLTLQLII